MPAPPPRLRPSALALCNSFDLAFVNEGVRFRRFEQNTYYYENIFREEPLKIALQLTCCVWVTVQARYCVADVT